MMYAFVGELETDFDRKLLEVQMSDTSDIQLLKIATIDDLISLIHDQNAVDLVGRFSMKVQSELLEKVPPGFQVAAEASRMGSIDSFFRPKGQSSCVMGLQLSQVIGRHLAHQKIGIDATGCAVLLGHSVEVYGFALGISKLGIRRLILSSQSESATVEIADRLRKSLLGIEIIAVPKSQLTQLPAECSIGLSLLTADDRDLISDISYVNFLRPNGIWLDWTGATAELGFEQDILNAGVTGLSALSMRCLREELIVERAAQSTIWTQTIRSLASAGP